MSISKPKVLIILANLGTPDAPTVPAVRAFLKQFLSDQRVIEIPKLLWALILHAFVLPFVRNVWLKLMHKFGQMILNAKFF